MHNDLDRPTGPDGPDGENSGPRRLGFDGQPLRLPIGSPWMNVAQAAYYTSLPMGQMQKLAAAGRVPRRRVGRRFVYHRDELDVWIRNDGGMHGLQEAA